MIMSDLKIIAESDHGAKVTDSVISVPVFFTDPQRRAVLDAAQIAGLNVMRLLHETTATALAYGIFKTSEFTETPCHVVFVDVGHSSLQAGSVHFSPPPRTPSVKAARLDSTPASKPLTTTFT